jgi:alpha-galactosidase
MKQLALIAMLLTAVGAQAQKFDDLAPTPPMGWNSWNKFGCNVDEQLIRETAEAMASSGMKAAGYEFVNIDDCWHGERDAEGRIQPDPERFPSGMKSLADYIHSLGLKIGIYSDAGWKTCAGRPGSRGREYQDAATYAKWGVDYLKYDWCNTEGLAARGAYLTMRDALWAAGRPVVLSICEWGTDEPWEWGPEIGHLWRTTGDIYPCWDCEYDHGSWSSWGILRILDMQDGLREHAGPGRWNDPDMMEVGNGMSASEDRAHFSLWAMLTAPLIAGNDLRSMSEQTRLILTNQDVIAIDQDPLGIQGFKYRDDGDVEIWFKPLAEEDWAMLVLNRGDETVRVTFAWNDEQVRDQLSGREALFDRGRVFRIRDSWTGKGLGTTHQPLAATVPPHDVLMVRLERLAGNVGDTGRTH